MHFGMYQSPVVPDTPAEVATATADGLLDGQKIAAETLELGSYNALLHSPVASQLWHWNGG